MREQILEFIHSVGHKVRLNFKSITLNFVFIFIFINLFQRFFGAENTIVGVVFVIVMQSSMLLDFTVRPMKNFFVQLLIMEAMTVSAFLIHALNPLVTMPLNFVILFILLYVFTFEYTTDLYMPYILSYLFLIFISPVSLGQMPERMLAVLVGTTCVILYHLIKGRGRSAKTVCEALTGLIDEARGCMVGHLTGEGFADDMEQVRSNLYKLSHLVYERRKGFMYISDASLAMLDCGLKLENLICRLNNISGELTAKEREILDNAGAWLGELRVVVWEGGAVEAPKGENFHVDTCPLGKDIYTNLTQLRKSLIHMMDYNKRLSFRPTVLSLTSKIKSVFHASPVRIVYSLRVAILLSVLTAMVLFLQLPHGKWLLFTVASVSLPFADDVGEKAKKRFLATLLGGCFSVIAFSLISDSTGRTVVMLFIGYLTAYFTDYRFSFACSTVGALGGAMLMETFGWVAVGNVFFIRLGYICVGIVIAYIANGFIYPFRRSSALAHLCKKHFATSKLVSYSAEGGEDAQLYYSLLVHQLLQEEQLKDNLDSRMWDKIKDALMRR